MYVDQSSIPDAEEGLFAKVDVEESTVISFYNGIRYDVKDTTIEMENCPYKISLNEDIDLDIPEDMISTDKYKATLAHKVSILRLVASAISPTVVELIGELFIVEILYELK